MRLLSRKEEILLLAIWRLREEAYGIPIREYVMEATDTYWSIGAIYDVLDRLKRNGLVRTRTGEPLNERGGKRRRYYRVTKAGHRALTAVREVQDTLWADLPALAFE